MWFEHLRLPNEEMCPSQMFIRFQLNLEEIHKIPNKLRAITFVPLISPDNVKECHDLFFQFNHKEGYSELDFEVVVDLVDRPLLLQCVFGEGKHILTLIKLF